MKLMFKYIVAIAAWFLFLGSFSSCTQMDEYLKYTDGKEILYIGKPEGMQMCSGKGRVQFYGILIDPKIPGFVLPIIWGKK